jgi:predicted transcriptional regulator
MEVHFTPDQEAQLSQIASHAGTDAEHLVAEHLVKDARLRLLEQNAKFRAGVQKGIEQADRREFIEEAEMEAASTGCLTPDAYPLDASRRSELESHSRLSEGTRATPCAAHGD